MKYIYYVALTQPNPLHGRNDFYSLELATSKKITSIQDLENLLPIAREALRNDLIERLKKDGYPNMGKSLPENSHDQVGIISFSLLRKEGSQ